MANRPVNTGGGSSGNSYEVLSFLARGQSNLDDILDSPTKKEEVVNDITTAYANWELCKTGMYGRSNDGKACSDNVRNKLSHLVPACTAFLNGGAPTASCEVSLATVAKKCVDNSFCQQCEGETKECRSICNYGNYKGEPKEQMQPFCEKMLTGLKKHYPDRKFVYGLAKVNMCSTETCRKREFNSLSKYKPDVCMGLTLKDDVYSVTHECANEVERLSSVYKQDCNEYFSDMLGLGGACDNMLPNSTAHDADHEDAHVATEPTIEPTITDIGLSPLQSAYGEWVKCYADTHGCKKNFKEYISVSNTFLQALNGNNKTDVRKQPCVKWLLTGKYTNTLADNVCETTLKAFKGFSHPSK